VQGTSALACLRARALNFGTPNALLVRNWHSPFGADRRQAIMVKLLATLNLPQDLKRLTPDERKQLAQEIRETIVHTGIL
jgi:Deoxyxylulose-5-phosphate synthase